MKLQNTRLLVDDFKSAFLFYRDILGLTASFGDENDVYTEFVTDGTVLALFHGSFMRQAINAPELPAIPANDRFVLAFGVDNVDETYARLSANGVEFVAAPEDRPVWGIRTAHLRDPEGNLVELFTGLTTSTAASA